MMRSTALGFAWAISAMLNGCGDSPTTTTTPAPSPSPSPSPLSQIAFVGSGGCDGADVGCVDGEGNTEQVIHAIEIFEDGQMKTRPELQIPTGGAPAWLTDFHNADKSMQCMFVTLADANVIKSYQMDPSGKATVVGNYSSGGEAPVHATVLYARMRSEPGDASDVLLVANYHGPDDANTSAGASAASMTINDDCSLHLADVKNHSGSSINPSRQGGAHVHSFTAVPYGQHTNEGIACDLGMDKIFSYAVSGDGKLTESSIIDTTAGVGPRHLAQRSDQVFVVTEMGMTINAYNQTECDGGASCLAFVQNVSLVPEGQSGVGSKAAEIVMAEDNSTLYATNRGVLNTVTVFGINGDGTLTQKQQIDAPKYPRGMTLALGGRVLLVAGQSETSVVSYLVESDGTLMRASTLTEGLPPHPAAFMIFEPAPTAVLM